MRTVPRRAAVTETAVRRRTLRRTAAVGTTVAALAGGLLMATAPTATAASSVCGSSYGLVGTYEMTKNWGDPYVGGHLYIYYSSATGKNCAVARPIARWAGDVDNLFVEIQRSQGWPYRDDDGALYRGSYHWYAGPVYTPARHQCIEATAHLDGANGEHYAAAVGQVSGVHCS